MEVHLDIETPVAPEEKSEKLPRHLFVNFPATRMVARADPVPTLDLAIRPIGDKPLQRGDSLLAW